MPLHLASLPVRHLPGDLVLVEASSAPARALGLMMLDRLPEQMALLLPRCRSVHTVGMRFPIDLVWLDADERALRIDRAVPPRRMRSCPGARAVVETRAGDADAFAAALGA